MARSAIMDLDKREACVLKLLATDMDGTILVDNEIPEESRALIEELYAKDILTFFVTGRMWKSPAWYQKRFSFSAPMVSCNGGIVHDAAGRVLARHPIPEEVLSYLIGFCRKEDAFFQFYNEDALYLSGYSKRTLRRYSASGADNTRMQAPILIDADPLARVVKSHDLPVKFVIMDEDTDKLQALRAVLAKRDDIAIAKSDTKNLEITMSGATKGKGLSLIADSLGVAKQDIIAIGDNENDLTMFPYAGLSIGVEGGSALVAQAADVMTRPPAEGGWAAAIRKYVLDARV